MTFLESWQERCLRLAFAFGSAAYPNNVFLSVFISLYHLKLQPSYPRCHSTVYNIPVMVDYFISR